MSWREDLVGKKVMVLSGQVTGVVAKLYEPKQFLRDGAEPDEEPVNEFVLQLDNGHAFLAGDVHQTNFRVMSPSDQFVFESAQYFVKGALQAAFRVAIASGIQPEEAFIYVIAALTEAERGLMKDDEPREKAS
jgi:hypothetical protein